MFWVVPGFNYNPKATFKKHRRTHLEGSSSSTIFRDLQLQLHQSILLQKRSELGLLVSFQRYAGLLLGPLWS
jgi:hypothetical protein